MTTRLKHTSLDDDGFEWEELLPFPCLKREERSDKKINQETPFSVSQISNKAPIHLIVIEDKFLNILEKKGTNFKFSF